MRALSFLGVSMHRISVVLALSLAACGASTGEDAVGGSASAPLDLAAFVYCDASVNLGGSGSFWLEHSAYHFADGSVLATCSIHDASREYTSTSLYGPNSPDGATALCALTYDVDAPSAGTWYFNQSGGSAVVSQGYYFDVESPMNGHTANLNCVTY